MTLRKLVYRLHFKEWPCQEHELHHTQYTYHKTCLQRHLKKKIKIGFEDPLSLNAGQKYCRMLKKSILQYFRPSLSNNFLVKTFVLSIFE